MTPKAPANQSTVDTEMTGHYTHADNIEKDAVTHSAICDLASIFALSVKIGSYLRVLFWLNCFANILFYKPEEKLMLKF